MNISIGAYEVDITESGVEGNNNDLSIEHSNRKLNIPFN